MGEKFLSSFQGGMDQDSSVNKYDNTHYFDAENMRLITKDSLSNGALTNINGNVIKLQFASGDSILGQCIIRDTVIFFVHNENGGKIYKYTTTNTDVEDSLTLVYTDAELIFDSSSIIRAIGNYENENIQKVYFTDGDTFFRHLNIVADSYPISTSDIPVAATDVVPNITFSDIALELTTGGSLKVGKIQYAYQLYSIHGAESTISSTSDLIHLTDYDESGNTYDYVGSEVGDITNKAINVTIDSLNTNDEGFTRIRLFALEYSVLYQIPTVRIVEEYNIEGLDEITIVDSGESIGNLTLEEFRFIQNTFYPKTLDSKNNYLFAANIKSEYFEITDEEFDSRAFRFNSSGIGTVYNGSSAVTIDKTWATLPDVTDEVYNKFNDWTNDYTGNYGNNTTYHYKYKSDGATIGGEGPNISYEFTTTRILLDDSAIDPTGWQVGNSGDPVPKQDISVSTFSNYANPTTPVGLKRDEVYRYGIVFKDLKGRPSFTKWIGDIRTPTNKEIPFIYYNAVTPNNTYADILGIEFTVDVSSISDKISGYQIVRAERTFNDKTILSTGVMGYMKAPSDDTYEEDMMFSLGTIPFISDCVSEKVLQNLTTDTGSYAARRYTNNNAPLDPNYLEFISPDIVINKNEYSTSNAFIETDGYLTTATTIATSGPQEQNASVVVSNKYWEYGSATNNKLKGTINTSKIYSPKLRGHSGSDYSKDSTLNILDGGTVFNNMCNTGNAAEDQHYRGARGTFSLLNIKDKLPISFTDTTWTGTLDNRVFLSNYRINKGKSIYGGSSYEARSNTLYYAASNFIPKTTSTIEVYGGDTYINYMWYLRSMWDVNWKDSDQSDPGVSGRSIENLIMFPVESSINLDLRLDNPQKYMNWGYARSEYFPNYKLFETNRIGVSSWGGNYPSELGNLYRYNSVYSATDKSKEYISKPLDFETVETVDTRITISDVKFSGEYIDSWLKFKFNNVLDVNSKYGSISKLITFKNNLIFFQENAVGNASVNERSLIKDNNVAELTLGTGGVLSRYDYLTINSGTNFYYGAEYSDNAIYYIDGNRKRIYKLGNPEEPISVVKGIDSLLDTYSFDSVFIGIDKGYNEVLFNIDGTVLAFNEFVDAFISTYTMNPSGFFNIGTELFSYATTEAEVPWLVNDFENVLYDDTEDDYMLISDSGVLTTVYKHNVGNKGIFDNNQEAAEDSTITLLINPNSNIVNSFDTLDLRTTAKNNSGVEQINDTVYNIEFSNDYQSYERALTFSTSTNESIGTIKRVARVWRTPLVPVQTSGGNFKRMVDTYIKVKIYYSNVSDLHFTLHDVLTYFRRTSR